MADKFRILFFLTVLTLAQSAQASPEASKPIKLAQKNDHSTAQFRETLRQLSSIKGKNESGKPADKEGLDFTLKGGKEVEGLILKQEYRFIGKSTTYFSPLGIRLDSSTLSVLFSAKSQKLCIYSDETKKYYQCAPETWKKKSFILFRKDVHITPLGPWKFVKDEKICGLNTKAYCQKTKVDRHVNEDTVWLTKEVEMTKDSRALLFSLLKVTPDVPDGVPLRHRLVSKYKQEVAKPDFLGRRRVTRKEDTDDVDYQTFSIVKAKIPLSKYKMPSGLTRAESEMEVFFNADESFGGDIPDLGSASGSAKSQSDQTKSRLPVK